MSQVMLNSVVKDTIITAMKIGAPILIVVLAVSYTHLTAVEKERAKDNIFTNVDSVVIL